MTGKGRLFLPLHGDAFIDFKENGKKYEMRACRGRYSPKFVYTGREAELRKGYSGEGIFGKIGRVVIGALDSIFNEVEFKLVIPRANSRQEAAMVVEQFLGQEQRYIAFEIVMNSGQTSQPRQYWLSF